MQSRERRTRSQILDSGQLAMFMTPAEIHERYQPLDADRQEMDYGSWTGTRTIHTDTPGYGPTTGGGNFYNRMYPDAATSDTYARRKVRIEGGAQETDEDLWDRKYEEASLSPMDRYYEQGGRSPTPKYINPAGDTTEASAHVSRTQTWRDTSGSRSGHYSSVETYRPNDEYPGGGPSLAEHMAKHGVPGVIGLGEEVGSMGKPQIVGGHHRLAVATREMSDQFLPVLHHESIQHARSARVQSAWKYT